MAPKKQLPALLSLLLFYMTTTPTCMVFTSSSSSQHIQRGFSASPDPSSSLIFQPLLTDPTSIFSFGFLRINSSSLDLAIIHLPSSFPLWRATPARPVLWSTSTSLFFNGSLVLSDPKTGVFWSTKTDAGDQLIINNSSNLQVLKLGETTSILWQSFDFPSDTIVQNQNFTSKDALFSTNQQFSMKLGLNYLALYMERLGPMYWKRTALEAKAQIVPGEGSIYARINPIGFLGLYQNEKAPVDVLSFDSFSRGIRSLRRLTLESDGNLRAYYYDGSIWVSEFKAISEPCDLPTACGAYGLCHLEGPRCECLDNRTNGCFPEHSGDLCGLGGNGYWALRRKGVDLANKELLGFQKVGSLEECEGSCVRNCSCWGAVYSNVSGHCHRMNYPIQTMMAVGDESKVGYFKVRKIEVGGGEEKRSRRRVVLIVVGVLILVGGCGFVGFRVWNGRRRRRSGGVDGVVVEGMPYKNLSSSSFRSIELSISLFRNGG